MSKYKKIMLQRGIMQKDLLDDVRRTDARVDKSLLSKIVNDICLPTRPTLDSICKSLSCGVLELYDVREVDLVPKTDDLTASNAVATRRKDRGGKSHGENIYNLTVEIPRDVAERVFAKSALRKLGYLSKTDFVRSAVAALDAELSKIQEKEKVAAGASTPHDDK
jgi:DNA-binding Xre family transcriptional regulator